MIKLMCPLLTATTKGSILVTVCQHEECAWWIEDKQKCAIAVGGDRKNGK